MNDKSAPHILTPPPGPRARAIIELDQRYSSPSYTRAYPLVVARAHDYIVEDVDGNRYLDFTSGVAVTNTGHVHPEVVRAIQKQLEAFIHMAGTDFYYEPLARLAERLARLPGEGEWRVFFTNSGAESIEAALKLARYTTGRTDFIAFYGAFHGRTLGALALTASKSVHHLRFHPTIGNVFHTPYPNPYRCPLGAPPERCLDACMDFLEHQVLGRATHPENVAAVIVEPIQGEGGYVFPPPEFLPRLRALTEQYGILLVVDEIQTGMGRTGKMFAYQHTGILPDIICLAKGIASGLPMGAMLARKEIMTWPVGAHANTFGGNPVACAAALKTIDLLEASLIENARKTGAQLLEDLHARLGDHPNIGRIEGLGLMIGLEFVEDRNSRKPHKALRDAVVHTCFQRGLLILGCGPSSIRLIPPLTLPGDAIPAALNILTDVIHELTHPEPT